MESILQEGERVHSLLPFLPSSEMPFRSHGGLKAKCWQLAFLETNHSKKAGPPCGDELIFLIW